MARKLSLLIAAVAVLAFAVPSMASAAEATYPAGTRAPVGQELTGTGTNITLTSASWGPITCKKINLNAKITVNDGTTVTASGENSSPFTETCFVEEESRSFKVTNVNIVKLTATGTNGPAGSVKNGTASFTFVLTLPTGTVCKFTGTNVPGTYVSTQSPSQITFTYGAGITSIGGCGTAKLDGSFSLHGPGSVTTPVVLH